MNATSRITISLVLLAAGSARGASLPLLVVSSGRNQILKYDGATGATQGTFVSNTQVGGSGSAEGQTPSVIAEGPDGNVYVGYWGGSDKLSFPTSSGGVLEYNQAGTLLNNLNVGASVVGIAFSPNGNLYISKLNVSNQGSVDQINPSGSNPLGSDTPLLTGLDGSLRGIGVIPNGASYLVAYGIASNNLNTILPNGSAGPTYGGGTLGGLLQTGIGVRSDGTIFLSQQTSNNILTITATSSSVFATSASDTTHALSTPGRFAFDASGNVYFGNTNHDAVAKYGSSGGFLGEIVMAGQNGLSVPQGEIFLVTTVPEPASVALAALGLLGLGTVVVRQRRAR